jgi:tRNA-2-methylthio-N6-dimethylallyladenosine synthase
MNVHDSGRMAGLLKAMGCLEAACDADADIILFNTCTVREHAHHKALSEIGRAMHMKEKMPALIVGVCGCVAQAEREDMFQIYPQLDIVLGPDQIHRLPEMINDVVVSQHTGSRKQEAGKITATELIDDPEKYNWGDHHPPRSRHYGVGGQARGREGERGRVTAFVTIMKGCNNNCSFCIVPHVRGREVSRPADDIIEEIKGLAQGGVKEVTLLGQNVNSYSASPPCPSPLPSPARRCRSGGSGEGKGGDEGDFVKLLRRITEETDILRIRYTSPHPKDLGDDLIEEHASNPKLCRHMHLPLQAGSDRILRAMKRSYNRERFIERAARLRERARDIEITTDSIVGFPGETEKDYNDTLDVVRKAAFDGMYAFKYSPRPGTKAAELKDDVPQKEKEARLRNLLELNARIWREKTQALIGTVQEVLAEGVSKRSSSHLTGRTFGSKIANFAGNLNLVGHIVPVEITSAGPNSLKGKIR